MHLRCRFLSEEIFSLKHSLKLGFYWPRNNLRMLSVQLLRAFQMMQILDNYKSSLTAVALFSREQWTHKFTLVSTYYTYLSLREHQKNREILLRSLLLTLLLALHSAFDQTRTIMSIELLLKFGNFCKKWTLLYFLSNLNESKLPCNAQLIKKFSSWIFVLV